MATPAALRAYEMWLVRFRHVWRGAGTVSFVSPLLYLAAMGAGVGTLVARRDPSELGDVSYAAFIAPGLVAAAAMQTAAMEAAWPVLGALRWMGLYKAQVATPLGVGHVYDGHLLWMVTRAAMSAAATLVAAMVLRVPASALTPLALPAAILMAAAFAAPIAAWSVTLDGDSWFSVLFRLGITPMFLFAGTFFPVSTLPDALRAVAYVTPLWHGTELCRALMLGGATPLRSLGHVAYLALWAAVGIAMGRRTYAKRLTS